MQKNEIGREILAYLADHPNAEDTLEGVVEWWLLERNIKYRRNLVRQALADLVKKELILERRNRNSQTFYQTNKKRLQDIQEILHRGS